MRGVDIKNMRSLKKGPFIDRNLLKSVEKINAELEKAVSDNKENQFVGFDQKDTNNTISASTARSLKIPTKI